MVYGNKETLSLYIGSIKELKRKVEKKKKV